MKTETFLSPAVRNKNPKDDVGIMMKTLKS